MTDNIIQGTQEWLIARNNKIGASEIYTLVHHYCREELQAYSDKVGIYLSKERPFRTIQELFMKIKFPGVELSKVEASLGEFGNGMEEYTATRLQSELTDLSIEQTKDFIINNQVHELAACSPDGYIEVVTGCDQLPDFDETCIIDSSYGRGVLELKTANFFANFEASSGCKLQYIFQHQFQMMVTDLRWGIVAVLMPKEKEFDDPFFKGKILEKAMNRKFEEIHKYYDLYHYVYPELELFQKMILKAIKTFQRDLDFYDTDPYIFPRNSEDKAGLQRERILWGKVWPEHYGEKKVSGEDELNDLLNQRYEASLATLFAAQEKLKLENQILGMGGEYCKVIGDEHKMVWTKAGHARFYKIINNYGQVSRNMERTSALAD